MIKAFIYKDQNSDIYRYKINGHANFAESGEDIVCSAVSVISQVTLMSLLEVAKLNENQLDYLIDNINGSIDVRVLDDKACDIKVWTLMKNLEIGLKSIEESYGKYITLKYREV